MCDIWACLVPVARAKARARTEEEARSAAEAIAAQFVCIPAQHRCQVCASRSVGTAVPQKKKLARCSRRVQCSGVVTVHMHDRMHSCRNAVDEDAVD